MDTNVVCRRILEALKTISETIDRLTKEQMTETLINSEWSIKDLLAHLTAWLGRNLAELERIEAGTWQPQPLEMSQVHDFNRISVEESRVKPLSEIRRAYDEASSKLRRQLENLPPELPETSPPYRVLNGAARHLTHHAGQLKTLEIA